MNLIQVVELLRYAGLGYVRKEDTQESSGDKYETMKIAESTSQGSSHHDCISFPNGSEHSEERMRERYIKS